jgi:hypothetical protein
MMGAMNRMNDHVTTWKRNAAQMPPDVERGEVR